MSETQTTATPAQPRIINCHVHTFTQAHTPQHFLPWPVQELVRLRWVRWLLSQVARIFDPKRETALGRYAEIVSTSYGKGQEAVFDIVKSEHRHRPPTPRENAARADGDKGLRLVATSRLTGAARTASCMFARRTDRVWALSAAAWCVAFGALSLYWAAGGTLGVDQLAVSLQERADERETGFVALVAATGIAKVVGAIVPLWLLLGPPSRSIRRLLLFLCWAGGALLALYGLTDVVTGSIRAARGTMENAIWYAALWGPTWSLGGLLFLMTAWTFNAARKSAR
jgi:Protein of unknown function (DUF3995)